MARAKESNPVLSHVSSKTQLFQESDRREWCTPSSQMNLVENLFPEFFNKKSDNSLSRSFKMNCDPDEGRAEKPSCSISADLIWWGFITLGPLDFASFISALFTQATPE